MTIKKFAAIFISIMAIVSLSSCNRANQAESDERTVRIGYFPNITHSQALLGIEDESFQKTVGEKANLEWFQFSAGPAAMEALFAENLDIAYIGSGPAINGHIRSNGDIQIISGAVNSGAVLLVGKDENIENISDLSGKKISIPQYGNTQDIVLRKILHEEGLEDKSKGGTVEIVQAKGADARTLLERGDISGALVPEPWGAIIEKETGAKVLLDENELYRNGEYSSTLIVARKEFLEENKDIVESFLENHINLTDYMVENPNEAKERVGKQLLALTGKELPSEVLELSFSRIKPSVDPEEEALSDMAEVLKEIGYVRDEADIENIFAPEALNNALNKVESEEQF
jgi:NitT/TauT family transport system substrate-binding protein